MATLSNNTDCNPTLTFDAEDTGKTFTITQTVVSDGGTDTYTKNITVRFPQNCEDAELIIDATGILYH